MSTPNPASTPWVPMWNLNGGVDFRYRGDWVAGSYTDGDIVVNQGVTYLCVRPTSSAPVAWPLPPSTLGYGTSLPASPADGQEHVLVDSVSAPTYQWRLRYNASSSSAYKWEFVGGASVRLSANDLISVVGGWAAIASPRFTIPRSGEYATESHLMVLGGSANIYAHGVAKSTVANPVYGTNARATGTADYIAIQPAVDGRQVFAAGDAAAIFTYGAVAGNLYSRTLVVHPIRVS